MCRPEGLAFSFNGGKDSTAVLHVLLAAVKQWRESNNQRWTPADGLAGVHVFYFESASDFPEVEEFVHASDKEHSLSLATYACPFKEGIERMLAERAIKGIFIGTRHGDPNCEGQEFFCPSSRGWPPFMRINPVLNWTYSDVWRYLRDASASYCCLYDKGYTSLGSVRDTKPNSALLRPDGTYAPAHELSGAVSPVRVAASPRLNAARKVARVSARCAADSKLERSGRHSLAHGGRQQSRVAELAHTAAIAIIGDEILCGKVTDQNSPFLVTQLHRLGWKVHKVVVLPDNVDVIGRCVCTLFNFDWSGLAWPCAGRGEPEGVATQQGVLQGAAIGDGVLSDRDHVWRSGADGGRLHDRGGGHGGGLPHRASRRPGGFHPGLLWEQGAHCWRGSVLVHAAAWHHCWVGWASPRAFRNIQAG